MYLKRNIIGVTGTGKSELARKLCQEDMYILSVDLFKDGLRFILKEEPTVKFKGLLYPVEIFLQPSKRLSVGEAILAARMKGDLVEIIKEMYNDKNIAVLSEGFYFPQNSYPTILLQRDYGWLHQVHKKRMRQRYGAVDFDILEKEVRNVMDIQHEYLRQIQQEYLRPTDYQNVTYADYQNVTDTFRSSDKREILDESYIIEGTRFLDPARILPILFDVLHTSEQHRSAFMEGVMHAWERTKKW